MTTQKRMTPQEELDCLPAWVRTMLQIRHDCENSSETARRTGHHRNTVMAYWKKHKHLMKGR